MRINGTGRGAQAGQSSGFDAAICRQPGTPDIPQAGLAQGEPAIGFDALASLARDEFVPQFERIFGLDNIRLLHRIRENEDSLKLWHEFIARERRERIETYRRLTLGKTSLWDIWRSGLPTNGGIEAAALARLRATARAVDPHARRTSQISRIAVALFDAFKRADSAPAFSEGSLRRVLLAAAQLRGVGKASAGKSPQKAARKFLLGLPIPPG